ncbi:MAG TPA: acyl-CoA desaturase [Streptosporangiaceae bacterium]|nr:acyl-CoA desaturase [Streptosporangiaceae bacterium]
MSSEVIGRSAQSSGPSGPAEGQAGSEYAELSRAVRAAGLLRRRPAYYSVRITVNLVLMAGGWAAFALLGSTWWQLLVAAFLAIMATQIAFIGHDAGHRQVCGSKRGDDLIGRIHGNLLTGLSFGWWTARHNRHHAHPNTEGRDPDIKSAVLAFTPGQAGVRRGAAGWLARHQAWLFFPMLLLEGVNLHVAGIRALGRRRGIRVRLAEAALLAVHFGAYLTAVFLVLSPLQALVFIAVQQAAFGVYMGSSFAPNHKGMPIFAPGQKLGYLRSQVLTSRNIRGNWLTDLALGGLNYQIEHHLFPSMPRPALRHAQASVRAFCAERGIPYCETSLIGSYAQVLRHLAAVGAG